ncbi:hypothetical protein KCV00_g96, partial [Aureobasidium melanogenum]
LCTTIKANDVDTFAILDKAQAQLVDSIVGRSCHHDLDLFIRSVTLVGEDVGPDDGAENFVLARASRTNQLLFWQRSMKASFCGAYMSLSHRSLSLFVVEVTERQAHGSFLASEDNIGRGNRDRDSLGSVGQGHVWFALNVHANLPSLTTLTSTVVPGSGRMSSTLTLGEEKLTGHQWRSCGSGEVFASLLREFDIFGFGDMVDGDVVSTVNVCNDFLPLFAWLVSEHFVAYRLDLSAGKASPLDGFASAVDLEDLLHEPSFLGVFGKTVEVVNKGLWYCPLVNNSGEGTVHHVLFTCLLVNICAEMSSVPSRITLVDDGRNDLVSWVDFLEPEVLRKLLDENGLANGLDDLAFFKSLFFDLLQLLLNEGACLYLLAKVEDFGVKMLFFINRNLPCPDFPASVSGSLARQLGVQASSRHLVSRHGVVAVEEAERSYCLATDIAVLRSESFDSM